MLQQLSILHFCQVLATFPLDYEIEFTHLISIKLSQLIVYN